MKLIIGLGNPGSKYENNRHNLGYMVVDRLVAKKGLKFKKDADLMCFVAKDNEAVYAKPTTFMNDSGNSAREVSRFFKINRKDILVIHDELDLNFGNIKLSFNGTSAGHRGVQSMIECLSTMDFGRLRIGIGRPSHEASADAKALADRPDGKAFDGAGHVLDDFTEEEKAQLKKLLDRCVEAVESFLAEGIEATMNRFN